RSDWIRENKPKPVTTGQSTILLGLQAARKDQSGLKLQMATHIPSKTTRSGIAFTLTTGCVALFALSVTRKAEAQSPTLSISLVPPAVLRVSWPSNSTSLNWQLMSTPNLPPTNWQSVLQTPVSQGNALVVLYPFNDLSGFFRLQQSGGG